MGVCFVLCLDAARKFKRLMKIANFSEAIYDVYFLEENAFLDTLLNSRGKIYSIVRLLRGFEPLESSWRMTKVTGRSHRREREISRELAVQSHVHNIPHFSGSRICYLYAALVNTVTRQLNIWPVFD